MLMPMTETATFSSSPGPAEIDLELFTFVERYATSLMRWDLILFFGQYPDTDWTPAEVAERLRRNRQLATKELDDLTYQHVLVRRYTPERTTYRLTRRAPVRSAAMRLAQLDGKPASAAAA